MYLSVMTHPDITYAVSTLFQWLENPSVTHLEFAQQVVQYVKATKTFSAHSWRGHTIILWLFWCWLGIKSQPTFNFGLRFLCRQRGSLAELKETANHNFVEHGIWIHCPNTHCKGCHMDSKVITWNLTYWSLKHPIPPSTIFCDNQGAIWLSKDTTFHARTKHINVHFHFIRQTVSQDKTHLEYIPTFHMITDTFTKSLSFHKFTHFRSLLGLC